MRARCSSGNREGKIPRSKGEQPDRIQKVCLALSNRPGNCLPKLCLMHRLSENAGIGISSPQNTAGSSYTGMQLPSALHFCLRENSLCTEHSKGINLPSAQNGTFPLSCCFVLSSSFSYFQKHREYVFLIMQICKELSVQHFLVPQERRSRRANTANGGERFGNPSAGRGKSELH